MPKIVLMSLFVLMLILAGCSSGSNNPGLPPSRAVGPFVLTVSQASDTLFSFKADNSGAISPVSSAPTGHLPTALLIQSPQTSQQNVFVINSGSNDLTRFNLDSTSGMLTRNGGGVAVGTNPTAITLFNPFVNGQPPTLYVLNQGSNTISAFRVTSPAGDLSQLGGSPFPTRANPQAMVLATPSNPNSPAAFLYVANGTQGTISGFHVNAGGSLTEVPGSPFPAGTNITSITTQTLSAFVYASDAASNNVFGFKIQPDGSLASIAGSPFAAGQQPGAVQVGLVSSLYVANRGGNSVSAYRIDTNTGALMPIAGSPFPTGVNPSAIATELKLNVYVANGGSNSITAFSVDGNSGVLTPIPGSPFAVANSPNSVAAVFVPSLD